MSIKPSWRFIQLVLLIGCGYVFRFSDCLVLNAINGHTFSPNASAEFECIIDPYTNSQTWFVDSVSVADCGIIVCSENASNPERYSFRPNTSAGKFIFEINPISLEDNDNVIICSNGENFTEGTRIFVRDTVTTTTTSKTVRSSPTENPCYCWCWFDKKGWCIFIRILFSVGGLMLSYIPAAVIYFNQQCFNKLIKDLNKKKRILFIPFCGCYLIIRHYKCCNSDKIQPGTQYERSLTNKSFTSDWTQASNGESDKEQDALDGILTICWTKHQRIDEDGICCENCKVQRDSEASHAYCLSDEVYICTKCLNESHKTCVLLWIPDNIAGKDHKLCCDEHYNLEDLKLKGVCQKCERFICSKCMAYHSGHVCTRHQQLHETCSDGVVNTFHAQGNTRGDPKIHGQCVYLHKVTSYRGISSQTKLCSGCQKHPIECLKVHTGIELCADCFEKGQEQEEGRIIENIILRYRQEPCQVHGVLGKGPPLPVEAYCFVCSLYMCVGCFKKHRRIYEYWSKYLEGNSFYCRCCKVNEIYPVVCFDLSSSWFKCAKCFLSKRESRKTNSHPKDDIILSTIDQTITETKHLQCSKARSKGKRISCKPEVYCLVCKLVMCTTCFRRHQQENKSTFTDAMIRNK